MLVRARSGSIGTVAEQAAARGPDDLAAPVRRLLPRIGGIGVIERLSALSGSDFTSVMLEVARRRAARESAASVLRRYRDSRFVRPGTTPWPALRRAEDLLLGSLPSDVDVLTLAPVVPLGTHSVLGTVSQDRVVTAVRACEVAADPTNALALEAAERRAEAGGGAAGTVRLAAVQRVVRAQRPGSAGFFAHFSLFGLVTAGRDEGGQRFECSAVAEQVTVAVSALAAAGLRGTQVAFTPLSDAGRRVAESVAGVLASLPAEIVEDPHRRAGRGYYRDLCFKINVRADGELVELGDGGFTDWTQQLTANNKERLLISGIGVDRLAALIDSS